MKVLKITGGTPLQGSIKAAGAKNAMTKLLVASLLSDKRCTFYNVPDIGDVEVTVSLCEEIGMGEFELKICIGQINVCHNSTIKN